MHRSRPTLLVISAAAAMACSANDASEDTAILAQDSALVARLDVREKGSQPLQLPATCGTATGAVQPSSGNRAQAEKLARQAYDAELLGQVGDARALLLRAAALDGTDRTAAYHLARTSESLGDRTTAVSAYCRFLALAPTSVESAEARQRLAALSPRETRTVAASARRSAPAGLAQHTAPHVARRQSASRTRVASGAAPSAHTTRSGREAQPTSGDGGGMEGRPTPSAPVISSTTADGTVDLPATTPPASRTASRGPSRVQGAGIGAVAGAMIGAAAGRNVKSAVIGATAGGLLGTIVVGQRMQRQAQ